MTGTKTNRNNYYFTVAACRNVKCLTGRDSFKNVFKNSFKSAAWLRLGRPISEDAIIQRDWNEITPDALVETMLLSLVWAC